MIYSAATAVALLPTFGVATRFLSGAGNAKPVSLDDLKTSGGSLGLPNLATSLLSKLPASTQDFPQGDSPQDNGNAGNADGVNTCGFSNFVQLKEDYGYTQASVDDCYNLIDSIVNDQEWIITQEITTVVENGTCAFQAVVSAGQGDGLVGALGNADIIDLVTDSIKQFGDDGYVGCHGGFGMYTSAAGAMPCDSPNLASGEQVFVDWFLTTPAGLSGESTSSSSGSSSGISDDGYSYGGSSSIDDYDDGYEPSSPKYKQVDGGMDGGIEWDSTSPPSHKQQGGQGSGWGSNSPPSYQNPEQGGIGGGSNAPPSYNGRRAVRKL